MDDRRYPFTRPTQILYGGYVALDSRDSLRLNPLISVEGAHMPSRRVRKSHDLRSQKP